MTEQQTDTDIIERLRAWAESPHECPRQLLRDAANRLHDRSCQLNSVLYRVAVAVGIPDKGGRVDADTEAIVAAVERRLTP